MATIFQQLKKKLGFTKFFTRPKSSSSYLNDNPRDVYFEETYLVSQGKASQKINLLINEKGLKLLMKDRKVINIPFKESWPIILFFALQLFLS